MEIVDRPVELLEKSLESKEIDIFLLGAINLQEGSTRIIYNHSDDLVGSSGCHPLKLILHSLRQIAELNGLNRKDLYEALIELLDNDLVEN